MYETGLLLYWQKKGSPKDIGHCIRDPKPNESITEIAPLSLKGLTGAFAAYAIGLGVSLLSLMFEKISIFV